MNIEIYQCPPEHKRAGYFTFRVDGQESLFYSTQEASVAAKVTALMNGPDKGTVRLKALAARAHSTLGDGPEKPETDHLALATPSERFASFMSRGKLAKT